MKKIIAIVLMACLLVTMISPAFANQSVTGSDLQQPNYSKNSANLTTAECQSLEKYMAINFSECKAQLGNVGPRSEKSALISLLTESSCETIGNSVLRIYDAQNLETIITECSKLKEVFQVNGYLYIRYSAKDGRDVMMSYSDTGLHEICVYDKTTDIAYYMLGNRKSKLFNFRAGSHYEISSEKLDIIHSYLDAEDYESLAQLEGIRVIPVDGGYVIEEEHPTESYVIELDRTSQMSSHNTTSTISVTRTPQTNSELYSSLIEAFPMVTNRIQRFSTTPASEVIYSRNNYIQIDYGWEDFPVGSTLLTIAETLDIDFEEWVEVLLSALGIMFDAQENELLENARIVNSATYEFTARKTGLVYDNTLYNDYVYVVQYSDRIGTFAGGFTRYGDFEWIYHAQSPTWNKTNAAVSATAIENYNWDVSLNGYCSAYNPSGFW